MHRVFIICCQASEHVSAFGSAQQNLEVLDEKIVEKPVKLDEMQADVTENQTGVGFVDPVQVGEFGQTLNSKYLAPHIYLFTLLFLIGK